MNFEVLKISHVKRNIIIAVLIVLILSSVILTFTKAKYITTQSIPLIQGTINYSASDFNMVAVYLNKGSETLSADKVPHVGYTLNEEQSTCESPDGVEDSISIAYEDASLTFSNVIKKGTKCNVYFDLIPDSEKPILSITTSGNDTSIMVTANAKDNVGIYYYYYKIDDEEEIQSEETNYIFDGLIKDSVHTITVRVEDAAGNEASTSKEVIVGFPTVSETIENLYENNQSMLAYDETVDNNLRYIGANPNNYVYFNCDDYNNPSSSTCELWRIIGIFNENSHGISGEKLVKLIRNDSIGKISWDSAKKNDWSTEKKKKTLNGDYLNGSGSYAATGIKNDTTRNMIANATWKLGGTASYSSASDGLANHFYGYERGTNVYSGNPTTWQGKIALMYLSDYGYATSGGTTTNREACLSKELLNWDESSYSDCKNNDWIFINDYQWTITTNSKSQYYVFYVLNYGNVNCLSNMYFSNTVRPSLYLSSNVSIISGDGSRTNPYTLQN